VVVPITDDSAIIDDAASNLDLFIADSPLFSRWSGLVVLSVATEQGESRANDVIQAAPALTITAAEEISLRRRLFFCARRLVP
jgi:hypothetical protein